MNTNQINPRYLPTLLGILPTFFTSTLFKQKCTTSYSSKQFQSNHGMIKQQQNLQALNSLEKNPNNSTIENLPYNSENTPGSLQKVEETYQPDNITSETTKKKHNLRPSHDGDQNSNSATIKTVSNLKPMNKQNGEQPTLINSFVKDWVIKQLDIKILPEITILELRSIHERLPNENYNSDTFATEISYNEQEMDYSHDEKLEILQEEKLPQLKELKENLNTLLQQPQFKDIQSYDLFSEIQEQFNNKYLTNELLFLLVKYKYIPQKHIDLLLFTIKVIIYYIEHNDDLSNNKEEIKLHLDKILGFNLSLNDLIRTKFQVMIQNQLISILLFKHLKVDIGVNSIKDVHHMFEILVKIDVDKIESTKEEGISIYYRIGVRYDKFEYHVYLNEYDSIKVDNLHTIQNFFLMKESEDYKLIDKTTVDYDGNKTYEIDFKGIHYLVAVSNNVDYVIETVDKIEKQRYMVIWLYIDEKTSKKRIDRTENKTHELCDKKIDSAEKEIEDIKVKFHKIISEESEMPNKSDSKSIDQLQTLTNKANTIITEMFKDIKSKLTKVWNREAGEAVALKYIDSMQENYENSIEILTLKDDVYNKLNENDEIQDDVYKKLNEKDEIQKKCYFRLKIFLNVLKNYNTKSDSPPSGQPIYKIKDRFKLLDSLFDQLTKFQEKLNQLNDLQKTVKLEAYPHDVNELIRLINYKYLESNMLNKIWRINYITKKDKINENIECLTKSVDIAIDCFTNYHNSTEDEKNQLESTLTTTIEKLDTTIKSIYEEYLDMANAEALKLSKNIQLIQKDLKINNYELAVILIDDYFNRKLTIDKKMNRNKFHYSEKPKQINLITLIYKAKPLYIICLRGKSIKKCKGKLQELETLLKDDEFREYYDYFRIDKDLQDMKPTNDSYSVIKIGNCNFLYGKIGRKSEYIMVNSTWLRYNITPEKNKNKIVKKLSQTQQKERWVIEKIDGNNLPGLNVFVLTPNHERSPNEDHNSDTFTTEISYDQQENDNSQQELEILQEKKLPQLEKLKENLNILLQQPQFKEIQSYELFSQIQKRFNNKYLTNDLLFLLVKYKYIPQKHIDLLLFTINVIIYFIEHNDDLSNNEKEIKLHLEKIMNFSLSLIILIGTKYKVMVQNQLISNLLCGGMRKEYPGFHTTKPIA